MVIANEKTYEYLKKDSQTSKEELYFSSFDADYDFIRKEYGSPENIIIKLPDIIFFIISHLPIPMILLFST